PGTGLASPGGRPNLALRRSRIPRFQAGIWDRRSRSAFSRPRTAASSCRRRASNCSFQSGIAVMVTGSEGESTGGQEQEGTRTLGGPASCLCCPQPGTRSQGDLDPEGHAPAGTARTCNLCTKGRHSKGDQEALPLKWEPHSQLTRPGVPRRRGPHPLPLAALEKLGIQTYCSSWPTRGGGP
ncbi:hypothetical protein LEMLEM_LOCUS14125, partial [Lemmus lemmus]